MRTEIKNAVRRICFEDIARSRTVFYRPGREILYGIALAVALGVLGGSTARCVVDNARKDGRETLEQMQYDFRQKEELPMRVLPIPEGEPIRRERRNEPVPAIPQNTDNINLERRDYVNYKTDDFLKDTDRIAMARALFGEARGCTPDEQVAIAYVILNRARDNVKWNGTDIKSAVYAKNQFSFANKGDPNREKAMNPMKYDSKSWIKSLEIAGKVMDGRYANPIGDAKHYCTLDTNPEWAKNAERVKTKDNRKHKFYRGVN